MKRFTATLVLAACAAPPTAPEPHQFELARLALERTAPERTEVVPEAREVRVPPAADDSRRLTDGSMTELEREAVARSPRIRAARSRLEAARTSITQADDVRQLSEIYRAFLADTDRRATATIAPSPNVDALSAEMARLSVAIAFEDLRRTIRSVIAEAQRIHADAAHLAATIDVLDEDIKLHESLVAVVKARFEAGTASQAGLLAFRARLESLRTERAVLEDEAGALRASWNRLIDRPEATPVDLAVEFAPPHEEVDIDVVSLALRERQEYRRARLAATRAGVAVRLAESMALPRLDAGSSRYENAPDGRFAEREGVAMPRYAYGVRDAQLQEMRARERTARASLAERRRETEQGARKALSTLTGARRRLDVSRTELVPLADQSFRAIRGAYEGNSVGYIELLDGARTLLRARLELADAQRTVAHAQAGLLDAAGVRVTKGA